MNATSNYFKTSKGHIFFFVDTVLESIESAFETASLVDAELSVYRAVGIQGPWDTAKIIGHRRRADILQDLSAETDKEELDRLHDELTSLQACYTGVGRSIPLVAVA